jgi:hypothetical protein
LLLFYEHDEEQEQVAASNAGGGPQGMLVNHPTTDKAHHKTLPSTGFSLIFLCLHKRLFISTQVYI